MGSATGSATSSNGEPLPAVTFDAPAASADESRWKTNAEQARQESPPLRALVDVRLQSLTVFSGQRLVARFPISTAARGIGSTEASYRTPLGRHRVHQKFGADAPIGTVFRSRINTHTVAPILTDPVDVEEDLILTRILWLDGLEPGLNRGPGIDSRERFIYIHGTNEEGLIGTPRLPRVRAHAQSRRDRALRPPALRRRGGNRARRGLAAAAPSRSRHAPVAEAARWQPRRSQLTGSPPTRRW